MRSKDEQISAEERFCLYLLNAFNIVGDYDQCVALCNYYFSENSKLFNARSLLFKANLLRLKGFAKIANQPEQHLD